MVWRKDKEMTREEFTKINDEEYLKFERIPLNARPSSYPEICALLYLENLLGPKGQGRQHILCGAMHEVVLLAGSDLELFTSKDVIYLSRCGVHWCDDTNGLAIYP